MIYTSVHTAPHQQAQLQDPLRLWLQVRSEARVHVCTYRRAHALVLRKLTYRGLLLLELFRDLGEALRRISEGAAMVGLSLSECHVVPRLTD